MSELTLYYRETCPYCQKVLTFMKENNVSVHMKNTQDDSHNKDELIVIGGKSQVPCLVIDGKALYESNDIIAWMGENLT